VQLGAGENVVVRAAEVKVPAGVVVDTILEVPANMHTKGFGKKRDGKTRKGTQRPRPFVLVRQVAYHLIPITT
jgi:hypothetical protein